MDAIQAVRELGKAIQADERYIEYAKAKKANDEDEELQQQRLDDEAVAVALFRVFGVRLVENALDLELQAARQVQKRPHMGLRDQKRLDIGKIEEAPGFRVVGEVGIDEFRREFEFADGAVV